MTNLDQATKVIRDLYPAGTVIRTADINREVPAVIPKVTHSWTPTQLEAAGVIEKVRHGYWRVR